MLSQTDLPVLVEAKALYVSGKLGFFENAYAKSVRDYQSCLDLLSQRGDQLSAGDKVRA